ncbi:hypothetical protein [Brevibacillus reuszeri]|uniref:hypothetical protein n=1 Tax=Brevibacillus reuszeri TaxID=54915 RepID=UPI003D1B6C63
MLRKSAIWNKNKRRMKLGLGIVGVVACGVVFLGQANLQAQEVVHAQAENANVSKYVRHIEFNSEKQNLTEVVIADKNAYRKNEVVKIYVSATDFSRFDKGIEVKEVSVINKTTGKGYVEFTDVMKVHKTPPGDVTSPYTWNNNGQPLEYIPPVTGHEPGTYEIHFVVVDSKQRSNRESNDVSVPTPAIATFTVTE